jgi:hypothetical protein
VGFQAMRLVNTDKKWQNDFRLMRSSSDSGIVFLITYRGYIGLENDQMVMGEFQQNTIFFY